MDWKDCLPLIERYKDKLSTALVLSVIDIESGFKEKADSGYTYGLMQVSRPTSHDIANAIGITESYDLFNPETNIQFGCYYLNEQLKTFKTYELMIAAYNAGPGAVTKYGNNIPPFTETQMYVKKVNDKLPYWNQQLASLEKSVDKSNAVTDKRQQFVNYILTNYSSFKPTASPSCANFATTMIQGISPTFKVMNWVPDIVELGESVSTPQIGDLIIYDNTDGSGLTYTHIGIVLDPINDSQIDFSALLQKPVVRGWKDTFNGPYHFIDLNSLVSVSGASATTSARLLKFYVPGFDKDGKSIKLEIIINQL